MTPLQDLLDAVDIDTEVLGDRTVPIAGLAVDSRKVERGDLFFAVVGHNQDGHRFVGDAIARGAAAVVVEQVDPAWRKVTVVVTSNVRRCLALIASRFHGEPSRALELVGVTGTNGKTTVTYLLEAIWRACGRAAGVIGTINYRFGDQMMPAPLTTPDALQLHDQLAAMLSRGIGGVAIEVSSHALALDRVRGCHWDVAVFTNLSHDHLDFHGDLAAYYEAKASLFHDHLPASAKADPVAVVNVDDAYGARLAREFSGRLVTFGRQEAATVHPLEIEHTLDGIRGALDVAGERFAVASSLIGEQHVYNVMAAVGVAHALGLPREAVESGIRACSTVPGRLERIGEPTGSAVLVDYAHTPHALESALTALRPMCRGRLVTVFGCGGCRDRAKRPVMGEIAGRLSDVVVLTSDNPRMEDPEAILDEIEPGLRASDLAPVSADMLCRGGTGYVREPDRRRAIEIALRLALPDDIVLVAGKGHEDYQIVGSERRTFDDRAEVRRLLAEVRGAG